jgi:hypothetical protein
MCRTPTIALSFLIVLCCGSVSSAAPPQAETNANCEQARQKLDRQLSSERRKLKKQLSSKNKMDGAHYRVTFAMVVPTSAGVKGDVVSTCDGGKQKIIRRTIEFTDEDLAEKADFNGDWRGAIKWCSRNATMNPGETNCPDQYAKYAATCAGPLAGGRACLITRAIGLAYIQCEWAKAAAAVCQCHNGEARKWIEDASTNDVCEYLKAGVP